ncbi:MAG TPA: TetR/AcrR family transcriptional regulator [Dongiaceae bacterium]
MTGLRERQKAERRRDILAAAAKLFRRDGFADTTIETIAQEAEVAAGTVYNYFESKGDLLIALVALDGEEVRTAGRAIINNPPRDAVQAVNKLLAFYIDHSLIHLSKELWRNAMATALTQPTSRFGIGYAELDRKLADQVGDLVGILQQRAQVDARIDSRIAGDVLFAVVNSLFMLFVSREEMPIAMLKKALLQQIKLVFGGLGTAAMERRNTERKRA